MAYKAVIDLTRGAQKAAQKDGAPSPFPPPDPELPEATLASLPEPLREGLKGVGWTSLMPVQAATIPYLLDGRDMVVQSRTGSGKTGAFLLPMLTRLDPAQKAAQALVLCPTRELARQIYDEFMRITAAQPEGRRLRAVAVYGGTRYGPQLEAFESGAQLVIGTPGRVLDHLERRTLNLDRLRMLVLDEADEMLSMGFYPDMRKLKRYLPRERQGAMFSATMPFQVQRVGQEFLKNQGFLAMSGGTFHVDLMAHRAYALKAMDKDRALARLIEMENPSAALIFANRRSEVEYLTRYLQNSGYDADGISSDLTQKAREEVMGRLRKGRLRLLIATDVAARGIDVADLSHVFQYDVPQDREYYVHRAGRTARAGKAGVSITLVTPQEQPALKEIASRYDLPLEWREVPTDEEVAGRVGERLIVLLEDRLRERTSLERERLARFVPVVRDLVAEGEPELLAMLLDDAYHRSLRVLPPLPTTEGAPPADASDAEGGIVYTEDFAGEGLDDRADDAAGAAGAAAGDEARPKKRRKKRKKSGERAEGAEQGAGEAQGETARAESGEDEG
jgi:ATP-dependent RNA helicase DeaD